MIQIFINLIWCMDGSKQHALFIDFDKKYIVRLNKFFSFFTDKLQNQMNIFFSKGDILSASSFVFSSSELIALCYGSFEIIL